MTAQHFFKVGQPQAQAKSMLLCLTHQLTERLPGMAAQLVPVVEQHGAGVELALRDTFEKFLLEPMKALTAAAAARGEAMPTVLLLIDALDEADDGRGDWVPVAALIAKE